MKKFFYFPVLAAIILSFLPYTSANCITISPKFASLTAQGRPIKISFTNTDTLAVKLYTSVGLSLDSKGFASWNQPFDAKNCNQWIVAKDSVTGVSDTCKVSIVPWVANLSSLSIDKKMDAYRILGKSTDTLFVNYKNILYKTGSDLSSLIPLSPFPIKNTDYYWAYLRTPAGSFIRNENDIYFSKDEHKWKLDITTKGRGIRNSFCFKYDSTKQITRIFAHDYSTTGQDTFPHSIYRKTITPIDTGRWEKVFTLHSQPEWFKNKTLFPACRHIHTVNIDPFTGHIWMGTGDYDQHNHIYYSDDNGDTWKQIGMGSQEWRVLSIWFTQNYIYWGMDSQDQAQKIFRVPRSVYSQNGQWPNMSPIISDGTTIPGVKYIILTATDRRYNINKIVGDILLCDKKVTIDSLNTIISINDPKLDYRELVTTLPNSSLWGNTTVINDQGDSIVLISANVEGRLIDSRPRVFGFKERFDNTVDIQELLSTNFDAATYAQFYPYEQDASKNIYFQTFGMSPIYLWSGIIKTTLHWNDNTLTKGGRLTSNSNVSEKDSTNINLKLINFDGKIEKWQQSDASFQWKDIKSIENSGELKDTLSVTKEKNIIKYIRAIVQKENYSAVASQYYKVDSLITRKIPNIITQIDEDKLFDCYPNPAKDILRIKLNLDSTENIIVEILSVDGSVLMKRSYSSSKGYDIHLPFASFAKGVYILRVSSNHKTSVRKIIKN